MGNRAVTMLGVVAIIVLSSSFPFDLPRASHQQPQVLVEDVQVRGNRRIPKETVVQYIQTKKGDPFDPSVIDKDIQTLNAQGFFDKIRVVYEDGPAGGKIVTFEVEERPIIRDIIYTGLKSVLETDVLNQLREKGVRLSKEIQFDPVLVNNAAQVIKDMLAEKGHPDAEVTVQKDDISAAAVAINFIVNEGPRVRVVSIEFEGNKVFRSKALRKQMRLVQQSSLFTVFTSKDVYFKEKLADDLNHVRYYMGTKGYIRAVVGEPRVEEVGKVSSKLPLRIPILMKPSAERGLKIVIPVDEGRLYRVGKIDVAGNTAFQTSQILGIIGLKPGDQANSEKIQKGVFENLKDLYGSLGYVQATTNISQDFTELPGSDEGTVDFKFEIDEGQQFRLHRIEFLGNHFTRDKVLRREVLLNEGDTYNQQAWKLSLLRLNQLGYFEEIKEEAANFRFNEKDNQLDIDLKVQEKGRQQIQFSGGSSGYGGAFVGLTYSTNNFLGFGEVLSLGLQAGNRQSSYQFGFTEPYFRDKPISIGFSVFHSSLQYFSSNGLILSGTTLDQLGLSSTDVFKQITSGASVSVSGPLQSFPLKFITNRSKLARFGRLGLTYSFSVNQLSSPTTTPANLLTSSLVTYNQPRYILSTVQPTFSYSTVNSTLDPTAGRALLLAMGVTGLGGDARYITPTVEFKAFKSVNRIKVGDKPTVLGFRVLAGHIESFGTRFQSNSLSFINGAPLTSRFFLGGDQTLRGFEVVSVSPTTRIDTFLESNTVQAINSTTNVPLSVLPKDSNQFTGAEVSQETINSFTFSGTSLATGSPSHLAASAFQPIGGDTELLFNGEYRFPIAGPISLVAFVDVGSAFNLHKLPDQMFQSNFSTQTISPAVIDPFGAIATLDEISRATTPETPAGQLPQGFTSVNISGNVRQVSVVNLNSSFSGIFQNYRASTGLEARVQVPVINVPFRLIFAYNPNAHTVLDPQTYITEKKYAFRFSVGRTF